MEGRHDPDRADPGRTPRARPRCYELDCLAAILAALVAVRTVEARRFEIWSARKLG